MARIRSAKPEWWSKVKWCALPRDVRSTYKGIWEVMADDDGRFQADTRLIKGDVWPLDDDITTKKIEKWLALLQGVTVTNGDGKKMPAVLLYTVDNVRYGFLPGFVKHQKISHPTPSKLPPPPEVLRKDSGKAPEPLRPDVDVDLDVDRKRSGADARARAIPNKLSGVALDDFLEKFYRSATPERRAEVQAQLAASLSPSGARIRKGEIVHARSASHLAKCMQEVMDTPPDKLDAAIVWVLRKLSDPELNARGQTVTEAASDQHKRDDKIFDVYHAEKAEAGRAWAKDNPVSWKELEIAVDKRLGLASDAPMYDTIRKTQLAEAAGTAAGFPDFDDWHRRRQREELVSA